MDRKKTDCPSVFQSILLDTDGTVTDILRHITGDDIAVTKISQQISQAQEPASLNLRTPQPILQREILLTGRKHYLHADSMFVVDRMTQSMREGLLKSDTPVGLLWQRERLESYREILARETERNESLLQYFPDLKTNLFYKRSYLVYSGHQPLGLITERFPAEYFR